MHHVARLLTVAVDRRRPSREHAAGEDGDHAALYSCKVLTRAIDVRVAQHRVLEPVRPVEGTQVLFESQLARAVRRERAGRMVLVCRDHIGLSIKRAAARDEDELPHSRGNARLQDVEAADDVDHGVKSRVRYRFRHLGLRRMVIDDLGSERCDRVFDADLVPYIEPQHLRLAIDVGLAAGAEVVEDGDLMPRCYVRVGDVRADEPGPTRNQDPH